jgi:hypothetical protein
VGVFWHLEPRSRGHITPPSTAIGLAGGSAGGSCPLLQVQEGVAPSCRGAGSITPGKILDLYMQNPAFLNELFGNCKMLNNSG